MKKRFKMVMLPTKKATEGSLYTYDNNTIGRCINETNVKSVNKQLMYFQPQHLYIVDTKATIEVGDWFVNIYDKRPTSIEVMPWKCKDKIHAKNIQGSACNKVIASTDESLNLPTIPEQLIQEYVKQQFDYVSEKWRICNMCGSFKTGTQEGLCSNCGRFGKTNRELALEWWNSFYYHTKECQALTDEYFDTARHFDTLTGMEIEQIWKREVHSKQYPVTPDECKPQVDWEMLKKTISYLPANPNSILFTNDEAIDNMVLFFNMLKKSSSFAHKAHVELRD
jgi:hypothetical protein